MRDVQYATTASLDARTRLHARASTSPIPWFSWLARRITWPPGATVVEVGCGTGSMWAEAPDPWPQSRYVLIDQSPAMVATAVGRASGRLATAVGMTGDAQAIPLRPGTADAVVANHMLYHVPDIPRAIAELARVLRAGGVALVAKNGREHMAELTAIVSVAFPDHRDGVPEVSRFGRETGGGLLGASFERVEWQGFDDALVCTEPADVVAYLTSFPPGEGASPAELHALRVAIDEAFEAGGGVLRVRKDTGAFVARGPQ